LGYPNTIILGKESICYIIFCVDKIYGCDIFG